MKRCSSTRSLVQHTVHAVVVYAYNDVPWASTIASPLYFVFVYLVFVKSGSGHEQGRQPSIIAARNMTARDPLLNNKRHAYQPTIRKTQQKRRGAPPLAHSSNKSCTQYNSSLRLLLYDASSLSTPAPSFSASPSSSVEPSHRPRPPCSRRHLFNVT